MATKSETTAPAISYPLLCMIVCSLLGGLITGAAFQVIVWWPLPISVAPYFEDTLFMSGFSWGAVSGALIGFILGFATDEAHFEDVTYE